MKYVVYFVLFWLLVCVFAISLHFYTKLDTKGKCKTYFICYCENIGPGICDGIHDNFQLKTFDKK